MARYFQCFRRGDGGEATAGWTAACCYGQVQIQATSDQRVARGPADDGTHARQPDARRRGVSASCISFWIKTRVWSVFVFAATRRWSTRSNRRCCSWRRSWMTRVWNSSAFRSRTRDTRATSAKTARRSYPRRSELFQNIPVRVL